MFRQNRTRRLGAAIALILLLASSPASAQTAKFIARFTGTTAGLNPGAGIALKIDVLRWSTDEEANQLLEAFKTKPAQWADALQAASTVGYVWTATNTFGYSIKLARHAALPDGGSRVVLAIDRPLGAWDRPMWKAAGPLAADHPFSIIELHVNRRGAGEGKASLAGTLVADDALKTPVLENYAASPVLLKAILADPRISATR